MTPDPANPADLSRLKLDELAKLGEQALAGGDYRRAVPILREAVRRAPFRHDLRELLSEALEGNLAEANVQPVPESQSTLEAFRVRQQGPAAAAASPELKKPALLQPAPSSTRRILTAGSRPMGSAASPRRTIGNFQRRHERGPMSAIVLGALMCFCLAAVAAALFFFITRQKGTIGGLDPERARVEAAFAQSRAYMQSLNYSLAIEQLAALPQSRERDERLAEIYMEIGNQAFRQTPPKVEAAVSAYTDAVQYNDANPAYGSALADAYYMLATQQNDDDAEAARYFNLAKQTLQAVIDRHPDYLTAYQQLGNVAIKQRDYTLLQQSLKNILDRVPADSEEAIKARDTLKSLGLREF